MNTRPRSIREPSRKLLQIDEGIQAKISLGTDTAILTLTWERMDIDIIDAVAVDGVLDTCSVDNRMWRDNNGADTEKLVGTCARSCTEVPITGQCAEIEIGIGSVYDVLFSKMDSNPSMNPFALRVNAPWVHTPSCLVSQGSSTVCGGKDITWHGCLVSIGDPAHVGTIGRIDADGVKVDGKEDKHVAFESKKMRYGSERADLVYLSLDRGMRITRIVTANTFSPTATQKLAKARSREEILQICVIQHPNECILFEQMGLPSTFQNTKMGWGFQQAYGSPVRAKSGVPGSFLWVADLQRSADCHISVGSWLMGSMPLNTESKITALFTQSASRVCDQLQPVVLVRPGFAWPILSEGSKRTEWSITFVEMQDTDELGVPTKRH
jgi:hypothetical protein